MALLLSTGCKSPFNRTQDSSSGPASTIGASGQYPIFNNELVSGGGAFEYPEGIGNNLSLNFDDHSNPVGKRSIRFSWNGQPADGSGLSATVTSIFAGVSLMHVPLFGNYTSTPGRDLRAAGYNTVTFQARGDLHTYTSVTIEAGGPNPAACITLSADGSVDNCGTLFPSEGHLTGTLTSNWQTYNLPITNAQQSAIKDLFKATFVFAYPTPGNTNPGQGGTIYLDQIFYKP